MPHKTIMYFSGSMTHPKVVDRLLHYNVYRLFTYAAPKEVFEYLEECDKRGIRANIMLDSGAFTSWNIGKPVELNKLIEYDLELIKKFPQHNFVFIALDVIPGSRGVMPTEVDIAKAVETSYSNFLEMVQAMPGKMVLPVYHSGESRFIRNRYMNHCQYLCLSMNQNLSEKLRLQWAREAAVPGYYYHGLAATGNAMLTQVDWYSVDSSGWLMVAAMGSILFPYEDKLKPISVSATSPDIHNADKHLSNFYAKEPLVDYIRSRGYHEDELANDYAARICWNIDMWNVNPWQKEIVRPVGLFD